jgi:hypothetical protein
MVYPMRAKFGLSLSNRAVLFGWATLDDLIDAAQRAESSGYFHGVWVGDNLLSKPRVEAIVTLSAIAARTQQVKLGTICLASFPLRDPLLLAIQWASLDVLSHGRTILAVCNGGVPRTGRSSPTNLPSCIPSQERVGRLIEGLTTPASCGARSASHMPESITNALMLPCCQSRCNNRCRSISPSTPRRSSLGSRHRPHPTARRHLWGRLADRRYPGRHLSPTFRYHSYLCRPSRP